MQLVRPFTAACSAVGLVTAGCQPSPEELAARHSETIGRFCLDCHNEIDRESDLVLENRDLLSLSADAEMWENVIRKLRGELMPPPGGPRPDRETVESFVEYLETSLDAAAAEHQTLARAPIHRLNRTEYGNAIRDLLALEIDVTELLPADDEGYGFDNIADILRVSPSLLEQYLDASARIASLAVGDPETPLVSNVFRAPPDLAQAGHIEGLPLGTRGGILIEHYFPLDAEYDFSVFLTRNIVGYMTGLEWPHELEITLDGERVFVAGVGGEADNAASDENFAAAANSVDERLRTRAFVRAGRHAVGVAFVARNSAESHEPLELHTRDLDLQNMNGLPMLDYVTIAGPHDPTGAGDTPSRAQIFTCRPAAESEELPCAEQILGRLARLAYRRPVAEDELGTLLGFYENGRARGTFDTGIQSALRVMLTSPQFLFRSETDPAGAAPGTVYPVDDLALASRLAFFLWSSLPDDELLAAAEERQLGDPDVYARQVRRMLADPRAEALVDNFAGQWLFLRNLKSARPDVATFPNFDENLRRALRTETELFFASIVKEDRSVTDLLDADYTFLNERLARHYAIPGIYGSHFRRVRLADPNRRGLLGQGSILTVTSYPNRTSPVLRGKWIMENVLGTPPPPPLPNVPTLAENEPGHEARSLRERLATHRENPVCATCHDVLDPLGLALENFDAVGRWRTEEPGGAIDASGQLADGTLVEGPVSLREALVARRAQFVGVVVEKLLTYALGRGIDYADMPTVRGIVRRAEREDYRFSELILGVVESAPFRMRMVQPETDGEDLVAHIR